MQTRKKRGCVITDIIAPPPRNYYYIRGSAGPGVSQNSYSASLTFHKNHILIIRRFQSSSPDLLAQKVVKLVLLISQDPVRDHIAVAVIRHYDDHVFTPDGITNPLPANILMLAIR